jgi:Fibronectin type III domain
MPRPPVAMPGLRAARRPRPRHADDAARPARPALARLFAGALVIGALVIAQAAPVTAMSVKLPVGALTTVSQWARGISFTGWALDTGTKDPVLVDIVVDGRIRATKRASEPSSAISRSYASLGRNHGISGKVHLRSGRYRLCLVAHNIGHGPTTRTVACRTVTVADGPFGKILALRPVPGGVRAIGWAIDYDVPTTPLAVSIQADGKTVARVVANRRRADLSNYGAYALRHGFDVTVMLRTGAHRLCLAAWNRGGGTPLRWRCQTVQARNIAPLVPTSVHASVGRTAATVTWKAPRPNGGTSITSYAVRTLGGSLRARVSATHHSVTFPKLVPRRQYHFIVTATNLAGTSRASALSNLVVGPPPIIGPVTSPALISTSRYIRNIHGRPTDATTTRKMGATDAGYNPSNHRYMVLLDIGGQTSARIGLSATSIYIPYYQLVTALEAYIDGYASTQNYNAPVIIAVGVNNDIDVRYETGKIWARQVINPLAAYVKAKRYRNMTIAGANDMEPGFIGTPAQTKAWLKGYLANTSAKFVFNGSADGCDWTKANGRCNNHWTAKDLYWLAGGAAPTRIISLPQIYNTTMAKQWKYISLTGVLGHHPKINFGGPLTEWTACYAQHGHCGSLANNTAWTALWNQLRSDRRVSQLSLNYGTDLRIN